MNKDDDFFYLGKLVKTHGIHGQLKGVIDADNPEKYKRLKHVFVKLKHDFVPYKIEKITVEANGFCYIKLKQVNTIEDAKKFVNTTIHLPLSELPELKGNSFYYHEVIGFSVIDNKFGNIGTVKNFFDYSSHSVMQVFWNNNEILIPVNDNIIKTVDRQKKEIIVECPDGLIELYLSK